MMRDEVAREHEDAIGAHVVRAVGVLVILVGFWPIAGYRPPPPPSDTAGQIADFYRARPGLIRFGLVLTFAGCAAWGPLVAVITRQMLRIKPPNSDLAYAQLVAGAVAWGFLLMVIVLSVAAFRPERSAELTPTIHDLGWILLIMPFVPFAVQNACLGAVHRVIVSADDNGALAGSTA
jgi:hypothetical protein